MPTLLDQAQPTKTIKSANDLPQEDDQFDPSSSPAIAAVLDNKVPGFTATRDDLRRPEVQPILRNLRSVVNAGLGIYQSPSGAAVVYNPAVVELPEIKALDSKGNLGRFFPSLEKLLGSTAVAPAPDAGAAGGVGGIQVPVTPAAPVAGPSAPTPAPIARARARATVSPIAPPSRRSSPGSGFLSQVGVPVV